MSDPNNESKLYYQQPFKSLCGPPQYAGGGHYTTIPASSQALRLPTEPSKAYQYINERQIPIDELGNSRLKLIGLGRGFLMKRQNVMFNKLESDIKVLTSCIEKIQANSQSKTENLVEEQYDEMSMMVKQLEKETTKSATDDTKTLSKQGKNLGVLVFPVEEPPQYAGGGHYTTIPASSQALRLPTEPSKAYQYINERQIPIDELGNSRLKLIGLGRGFLMKRQNVMFNKLESDIKVLTSCIEKIQANSQSKTENLVEEQYDEMSMMVKQLEKETTKSATDDTKTLSKQDLNHNKPANIELAKKVENKQSKSTLAGSVGLGRGGNPQSRQRERNLSGQNVGGLACQSTVKANIVSPESVNEKKGFSPKKQSDIIQGGIEPDKVQRKATKSPPARCVGYGRGGNPQTRQRERSLMRTPVGGLVCQSAQDKVTVKSEMPDKACHQEESKEDAEKKLFRKLTKKLNAIERLRMKRKQGEKLTKEEEQKIKLRALIKRELACLS